jgi:hypothetical protein
MGIDSISKPILFYDENRILISSGKFRRITFNKKLVLFHKIKWVAPNKLVLNLDKTNIMKFITKNSSHSTLHTVYKEIYIQVEATVNKTLLV